MINKKQFKEDARAFLKEHTTAVIATSFNNEPRAATVYYYVDDDFNFYFLTKRNTSNYINIEMNPHVAVVVGTGPKHITVQVHGIGESIILDKEKEDIINKILNRLSHEEIKMWPIEEINKFKGRHVIAFKIKPERVVYMNLDSDTYPHSRNNEYIDVI